jgi:hypothetical protein
MVSGRVLSLAKFGLVLFTFACWRYPAGSKLLISGVILRDWLRHGCVNPPHASYECLPISQRCTEFFYYPKRPFQSVRWRTQIESERLGSRYRSGRSPDWLKAKNPEAAAMKRETEEEWGRG